MDTELSEQEQIEQIKKWFKQNGVNMILAIALGVLISFTWHRWQANKERALAHASVRYEQLLTDLEQNNVKAANESADYLIGRYPQTAYASLAKLIQARIAISANDLTLANTKFDWIIEHAKSPAIKQIARIRKARVLLDLNDGQQALTILQRIDDPGFIALTESVKGDCYAALRQIQEARMAYQTALQNLPENQNIHSLIQMKLDNLPVTGT